MLRRKMAVVSLPAVILDETQTRRALFRSVIGSPDAALLHLLWRNILILCLDFYKAREEISVIDFPFFLKFAFLKSLPLLHPGHGENNSRTFAIPSEMPQDWVVCPQVLQPWHLSYLSNS